MNALHEVLTELARTRAAAVALRFEDSQVRYADLQRLAMQAAAVAWVGWGVRPGDRVAWLGGNHPALVALLFGLSRIGAILAPLNFRLAPPEWERLVRDCRPRVLVHDAAWADAARELAGRCGLSLHDASELEAAAGRGEASLHGAAGSPALLVYTSGTTGGPKAAVHTQANLTANMRIASRAQGLAPDDIVLTVLPMFHVGGLCIQTLPAIGAGAQVVLHPRFDAGATLAAIERERPTLTLQVPATMKALVEHPAWPATNLSSLRAVWAGSSVIPAPLIEAFHARGVPVCNVYGATETGPFSIALPPSHAFDHVGSCGWPADGVEAKCIDVRGGEGEVLLRAANVVQRYWPDEPACDAEGWFHTGDLARVADDGSFTIVGRAKDLIISGGENIHPAEIEEALAQHAAVQECAAFGLPDAQWGEAVAVVVVARPGLECSEADLRGHLAQRLARYKIPRRWFFADALPKTALGKVRRSVLVRTYS